MSPTPLSGLPPNQFTAGPPPIVAARKPVYPIIGSIFGRAISHHDGREGAFVRWCEECEKDAEDQKAFGFTLKKTAQGNWKAECWEWEIRPVRMKATIDHRACATCTCKPKMILVDREVRTLKPGHMHRLGIPWSTAYATPEWKAAHPPESTMQDFLVTFGRRSVSPNFWSTNAPRRANWGGSRWDPRAKKHVDGPPRRYGGGRVLCFEDQLQASRFVRKQASWWGRAHNIDPSRLDVAFWQWARLRTRAHHGPYEPIVD